MAKIPVAILGATGAVGQRLVTLLYNHPWFEIAALTGSERTVGRPYGELVRWVLDDA
ncbi:MAG: aspartate-semialdehyde dehydrogenase, partial [Roseiflexaceae bacterium]|nr:aspartate-semialdehyde dehydrogenase [Roseiflexaceae bacterium]